MRIPPRFTLAGGVATALLSSLLLGAPATAAPAPAPAAVTTVTATASVGSICYSALPGQAYDTLRLIDAGGPFPYSQDGSVFQNREGVLPSHTLGYYHEYTVKTPNVTTRGARRIVTGNAADEDYYTSDHYASFDLIDHGC
ncbi:MULTISPECIES: ribonuclease domain-containing protein [unclassified Streptomyces]|uniref:ribonuclease domain-containing protein n=1 Tax=unclassified Streptomyces TaxID=2593676 RepID=UPI0006F984BE|nr:MULTISPECIES: ribonuclease domain-containing protein [unclassified Streptomyces]KQX53444.1 ribonuclease [Streptomyces sp. Root1304]KRA90362.1 ribonuclease [Streptomyces sp. Root66D1]